jgi:TonB family protein
MATPLNIKIYQGDQLIATKEYDRDIIKIGRLSSAHLCLEDEKVSRIHSVLEVGNDGALNIIDMGSVEGTWVNGKRVTKGTLKFGDEIKLGNTRLILEKREGNGGAVTPQEHPTVQISQVLVDSNSTAVTSASPVPSSGPNPVPVSGANPVPPAESWSQAVTAAAAAIPAVTQAPSAPAPGPAQAAGPVLTPGPQKALEESFFGGPTAVAPAPAPTPESTPAKDTNRAPLDPSFAPTEKAKSVEDAAVPKPAPQPRAPARSGEGPMGLEVRYYWGDALLGVSHCEQPRNVIVGTGKTDFTLAPEQLGGRAQFAIVRPSSSGDFAFCFEDGMQGELHHKDEVKPLSEIRKSAEASTSGGYAYPLKQDEFAWVDLGGVRAEFAYAPTPKKAFVPIQERVDYQFLNLLLLILVVVGGFVISAVNFPYDTDTVADDLFRNQTRLTKLLLKTPEKQKPNKILSELQEKLKRDAPAGEMAERHKGTEGKMGRKDAPERNTRSAPRAIDINAKELVKSTGLVNMFGRGGGGLSTIFGTGGLGGDLKGAIGNMFGSTVGDAKGFGGLGLKGTGGGGGGTGMTIGIGSIGTKGRGGGLGGYGNGVGGLGEKKSVDVGISSTDAVVMGSLDKELIRQVIHRHRAEIRYCYEKELVRSPSLKGKVGVKFVITATGSVQTAKVDSSSMNNSAVEECVVVRVRSWEFPKPKGGGIVIVTYPFVFTSAGE